MNDDSKCHVESPHCYVYSVRTDVDRTWSFFFIPDIFFLPSAYMYYLFISYRWLRWYVNDIVIKFFSLSIHSNSFLIVDIEYFFFQCLVNDEPVAVHCAFIHLHRLFSIIEKKKNDLKCCVTTSRWKKKKIVWYIVFNYCYYWNKKETVTNRKRAK